MRPSKSGKGGKSRVAVENGQDRIAPGQSLLELIERTALECVAYAGLEDACDIGVLLVDDVRIRELNNEFRGIDAPTDVLSFPMLEMEEGAFSGKESDLDMDTGLLPLGDIVISLETAGRQAAEYGHSFERELAFLTSHGVFHLLGFDHEDEAGGERMFENQEKVLARMGLQRQ